MLLLVGEEAERPYERPALSKAYLRGETLFVKRAAYVEGATYPDYNCNFETYTAGAFIEVESLAPLQRLEPGAQLGDRERLDEVVVGAGVEAGHAVLDRVARGPDPGILDHPDDGREDAAGAAPGGDLAARRPLGAARPLQPRRRPGRRAGAWGPRRGLP